MRRAIAPLVILLLALLLPMVPFVVWGDTIEPAVERWVRESESKPLVFALVILALATDVVLPIPSSFVSTFAGARLGFLPALIASTIGMTLGALLAFALARRWGSSLASRFAAAGDLERMEALAGHYGPLAIAISRPLPVLAEATVLVLGTIRLPWRRFLADDAFGQSGRCPDMIPRHCRSVGEPAGGAGCRPGRLDHVTARGDRRYRPSSLAQTSRLSMPCIPAS